MRHHDEFFRGYLECALWSSTDNADDSGGEPLDANYDADDIDAASLEGMRAECDSFLDDPDLSDALDVYASAMDRPDEWTGWEMAGHDFWLTRNGHGAGFWDRPNVDPKTDDARAFKSACDLLTDACRPYGSLDLYVGDDGKVYAAGMETAS